MTEKQLKEYGIANSNNLMAEAYAQRVPVERVARGYTYTTRDDDFPPTRLDPPENPFAADVLQAQHILDLGCGVGRNLPWIMEHTQATYWGLDPNPVMLDGFWKVTKRRKEWENRVVLVRDFAELGKTHPTYTPATFDVVVCTFVFQHLGYRAPAGAMNVTDITQAVMRYTRPGTIWFLLEHIMEEPTWLEQWFNENHITPDVHIPNYTGLPEMTHRGNDAALVVWRQV